MKTKIIFLIFITVFFGYGLVFAHCDTLAGPVVQAARKALETGDVRGVLIWVRQQDEDEVKEAFKKTRVVRELSQESGEFTDNYFFETVVRLHRAAEGAPYTGLQPATSVSLVIVAADETLEKKSAQGLIDEITGLVSSGIGGRFNNLMQKKKHMEDSVEAGREYVKAYIEYTHYIEKMHEAASGSAEARQ